MPASTLANGLDDVVESIQDDHPSEEKVSLGEVLDELDQRTYGPLLMVPAAVAASPLGGLPGMPIVTGAMILVLSGQMLFTRSSPWLPRWVKNIELPRERLIRISKRAEPWVDKVAKFIYPRAKWLVRPPSTQLVALCCMGLAALFFPLGLVPLAVFVPAAAVLFFSLGLVANDGVMVAIGYAATAAAALLTFSLWPW